MAKVLFYKITVDCGFAPNPFWDYLTLATCTPNHMRANLENGDWIVGLEAKSLAKQRKLHKLKPGVEESVIFCAKITEIKTLTQYFIDPRFENKKFQKNAEDWRKKVGDNVYYCQNGMWKWIRGHIHETKSIKKPDNDVFFKEDFFVELWKRREHPESIYDIPLLQDIRGNRVFISEEFSYFGDLCIPLPVKILDMFNNRGIKYYPLDEVENELKTLMRKYGTGQIGNPITYAIDPSLCGTCKKGIIC